MRQLIELSETDIDFVVNRPNWASDSFLETVLAISLPSWPEPALRVLWIEQPGDADRHVQQKYGAADRYLWFLESFYINAGWTLAGTAWKESGRRSWTLVVE